MAGVGLQSTLSPVNLHSITVCDMYTCAVLWGVHSQVYPEGGSEEIKEESCHHSRQALTAIECIPYRMEMLFMCHLKRTLLSPVQPS